MNRKVNKGMNDFEQYLIRYGIDPFYLYRMAEVRYLTVHNAIKGNLILPKNAKKIKDALYRLTGVPYVGSLVLIDRNDKRSNLPPIRIKQLPKNQQHS
jgi:hypothetical protein